MRTRKWVYVEQEARRLTALGLAPKDIAARLHVNRSTVTRWLKAGKLKRGTESRAPVTITPTSNTTPAQWAAAVRANYALDATDEQLVTMAESNLLLSRDAGATPSIRMQAGREFRATVKQLALVARASAEEAAAPVEPKKPERKGPLGVVRRRPAGDPRRALMAGG